MVHHDCTSLPRTHYTATHDRAHSKPTMRSHGPQAQSQITKAATADPHILLRGPPEAQNTNARQRAHNQRLNRTQCKGDPQLQPACKGGEGSSVQKSPKARPAAAAAISTYPRSASQRPRPRIQTMPKMILNLSCLRTLTYAANMGD